MAERRGLFELVFGKRPARQQDATRLQMLNGYTPVFTTFGSNPYTSDVGNGSSDFLDATGGATRAQAEAILQRFIETILK